MLFIVIYDFFVYLQLGCVVEEDVTSDRERRPLQTRRPPNSVYLLLAQFDYRV